MQKGDIAMQNICKSIYQTCREAAGFTQEHAAPMLGVSLRSLADYEAGRTAVPNDVAYRMVTVYNAPYLAVQHLHQASDLGALVVPAIDPCDLQTASLRLINRVLEFADQHRDRQLMQIAEDGVISESERPMFDAILADLDALIKAGTEVKLAREKREE